MKRIQYETDESFRKRKWFITNYLHSYPKDKETEAERLSEIWINMITLNSRYPEPIEKKIYNFLKTVRKNQTIV